MIVGRPTSMPQGTLKRPPKIRPEKLRSAAQHGDGEEHTTKCLYRKRGDILSGLGTNPVGKLSLGSHCPASGRHGVIFKCGGDRFGRLMTGESLQSTGFESRRHLEGDQQHALFTFISERPPQDSELEGLYVSLSSPAYRRLDLFGDCYWRTND